MAWIFVLVLFTLIGALSSDREVNLDEIVTKATERSGTIRVYRRTEGETSGVTIALKEMKEFDIQNKVIRDHTVNNFEAKTFTLSPTENEPNGRTFSLSSSLGLISSSLTMLLSVTNKTTRLRMKIERWPFCGVIFCDQAQGSEIGEYLDVTIEIKGQGRATPTGVSQTYDLGGATVVLPRQVVYTTSNNVPVPDNMPWGYPKLEDSELRHTFIFRFRPFVTSVLTDPLVVELAAPPSTDQTLSDGSLKVVVRGKSGKVEISTYEKMPIVVEFLNMKEKTADGVTITDGAHSYHNFDSLGFELRPWTYGTNISAKHLGLSATLGNGAKLEADLYVFTGTGSNVRGECQRHIAFSVSVRDWRFCEGTQCEQNEVGVVANLTMALTGAQADVTSTDCGTGHVTNDVLSGDDVTMKSYELNETKYLMNAYPVLGTVGSQQIIHFRYPKSDPGVHCRATLRYDACTSGSGINLANGILKHIFVLIMAVSSSVIKNPFA